MDEANSLEYVKSCMDKLSVYQEQHDLAYPSPRPDSLDLKDSLAEHFDYPDPSETDNVCKGKSRGLLSKYKVNISKSPTSILRHEMMGLEWMSSRVWVDDKEGDGGCWMSKCSFEKMQRYQAESQDQPNAASTSDDITRISVSVTENSESPTKAPLETKVDLDQITGASDTLSISSSNTDTSSKPRIALSRDDSASGCAQIPRRTYNALMKAVQFTKQEDLPKITKCTDINTMVVQVSGRLTVTSYITN